MASSKTTTLEDRLDDSTANNQRDQRMVQRAQWIRAAILGANDGLISTTSLMLGVGAAKQDRSAMVFSGLAGALAGALSMAVGEFVSVSTQRDIERSTTTTPDPPPHCNQHHHVINCVDETKQEDETAVAMSNPLTPLRNIINARLTNEINEKISPYFSPGRSPMMKVITEDANTSRLKPSSPAVLETLTKSAEPPKAVKTLEESEEEMLPNPFQAAGASAMAFLCGSCVPLLPAFLLAEYTVRMVVIVIVTTIALAVFGGSGAHLGGSPVKISAARVVAGGWIAMGITYALLKPFDKQ